MHVLFIEYKVTFALTKLQRDTVEGGSTHSGRTVCSKTSSGLHLEGKHKDPGTWGCYITVPGHLSVPCASKEDIYSLNLISRYHQMLCSAEMSS